jgi:hypothetical protein
VERDPHSGPVTERAWHADALARERGRVEIFNATRPDGLDGWTMDLGQYELMRAHILAMIDDDAGEDGSVFLGDVVRAAQERYATHPLSPRGTHAQLLHLHEGRSGGARRDRAGAAVQPAAHPPSRERPVSPSRAP